MNPFSFSGVIRSLNVSRCNTDFSSVQIESPCIGLCTLNNDGVCIGCYRSMDEICAWADASGDERRQIMEAVERRRHD